MIEIILFQVGQIGDPARVARIAEPPESSRRLVQYRVFELCRIRMLKDGIAKRHIATLFRTPPTHRPERNSAAKALSDMLGYHIRIVRAIQADFRFLRLFQVLAHHPPPIPRLTVPGIIINAHERFALPAGLNCVRRFTGRDHGYTEDD